MHQSNSRWTLRRCVKRKVAEHLEDLSCENEQDFLKCTTHHFAKSSSQAINTSSIRQLQIPTALLDDEENNFPESDVSLENNTPISESEADIFEYDMLDDNVSPVCSDSEEEVDASASRSILEQIQIWAIDYEIKQVALRDLLTILKPKFPELPKDPRTVLNTPKDIKIKATSGGQYYHNGLKKNLKVELSHRKIPSNAKVVLQVNVDGMSLHNSTKTQFWPILAKVVSPFKSKVFTIGIYSGTSKPTSLVFMEKFIEEMNLIFSEGLQINGRQYYFSLDCICADAPARAFLKGIIAHNGYYGCEKCVTKGERIRNTTSFSQLDAEVRTDESFLQRKNLQHHLRDSPLENIMGMVSQFPYDYMHLACLGVMRRILHLWVQGPPAIALKKNEKAAISGRLLNFGPFVLHEFSRKPRSLKDLSHWKATEFRLFLLYIGPYILQDILSHDKLDHFMQLHVAMSILVDPLLSSSQASYANILLRRFIKNFPRFYPTSPIVYNIHSLAHLTNDVKKFGCLDNFSCFSYESYLGEMKKLVRGTKNPLKWLIVFMRRVSLKTLRKKLKRMKQVLDFEMNTAVVLCLVVGNIYPLCSMSKCKMVFIDILSFRQITVFNMEIPLDFFRI